MSPDKKEHTRSIDEHMELLERRANVVRSRLLRTIDALDTRRHQVTEIGAQAKKAVPIVGMSVLGVAAVAAGTVIGIRHLLRSRRERLFSSRIQNFVSQFRIEREPSFGEQVVKKLALTVISMVATELSRHAIKNVVDGRLPDGRLVVGHALEAHHEAMSR